MLIKDRHDREKLVINTQLDFTEIGKFFTLVYIW